jgi:hypothetical protein
MRWQRQCVGIDHRIHHDWTALARKCRCEPFSQVAWFFDANALRAHRLGDFGEIRVLEIDAEWDLLRRSASITGFNVSAAKRRARASWGAIGSHEDLTSGGGEIGQDRGAPRTGSIPPLTLILGVTLCLPTTRTPTVAISCARPLSLRPRSR